MINIVRFYNDPYLWLQIKRMIFSWREMSKKEKIPTPEEGEEE
jgi:hypothetical protein